MGATSVDERELRRRQAASQRGFFAALGHASPGARLVELGAVQATIVPARPWFSIFNSVLYRDGDELAASLPALAAEYARFDVKAWTVWVPPDDDEAGPMLEAAGHTRDSTPLLMAAPIDAVDLEQRTSLDLVDRPSWRDVALCNDRAHGVLEPWTMAAVFETAEDPAAHLHAARVDGEVASALIAREEGGDCYLWFVATVPEAQRRGLAAELVRHALREARTRGCDTTTLESTRVAEPVYARLGYEPLGRYAMWERREG